MFCVSCAEDVKFCAIKTPIHVKRHHVRPHDSLHPPLWLTHFQPSVGENIGNCKFTPGASSVTAKRDRWRESIGGKTNGGKMIRVSLYQLITEAIPPPPSAGTHSTQAFIAPRLETIKIYGQLRMVLTSMEIDGKNAVECWLLLCLWLLNVA